jgi:hypothetical protein
LAIFHSCVNDKDARWFNNKPATTYIVSVFEKPHWRTVQKALAFNRRKLCPNCIDGVDDRIRRLAVEPDVQPAFTRLD